MAYKHGTFVWFELVTDDIPAAKGFYPETIGWKAKDIEMNGTPYTMLAKDDVPQCGVMNPPQAAPNHWTSYLSVPDVDATLAKVKKHGGKVLMDPITIPNIGKMALVADPQGATFNVMKGETSDDNATAGFHWNELWAKNAAEILPFYREVFGYDVKTMDMPQGKYHSLHKGDKPCGGIMDSQVKDAPAMWCPYIGVDDCDATVERIKSNGGDVKFGPLDIEQVGRFAVVSDNKGAVFGVIKPAS